MSDSVNVVPVIDTSNSMTYYGYVDITKRDSKAFVSYARAGDGLAVVNYDTNAHAAYPSTSSLAIVDANLSQAIQAANAIDGLNFTGAATNIGGGIVQAKGFLDSATTPKAMVLLSDGYQNHGTDPLSVLPDYPIYTCAMGPNADTHLMQQIASQTGGQYYNAPYPSTMMFIFNEIRSLPTFVNSVQNKLNSIVPQGYALVPATLSADNKGGQFGIVWDDNSLTYTTLSSPGPTQISITLVDPTGNIYAASPQIVGEGYVVFDLDNPAEGTWYAQVISGAPTKTIQVTTGGFELPNDPASSPNLVVKAGKAKAGKPLKVETQVLEGEEPLTDLHVTTSVMQPTISVKNALKKYGADLKEIRIPSMDRSEHIPENIQRLSILRQHMMPRLDILAHRKYPLLSEATKARSYQSVICDTEQAGDYSIHVEVTGISRRTKRPFSRHKIITGIVE